MTICVTKIMVSHAAGIWESDLSSITSFVALIKDAGVAKTPCQGTLTNFINASASL